MLTCTTRPMFPTHKMEGSIAPTDSRQYWGDGCTTYGSLVIRAEKNQGRGCPCMLQILRYEWMQLYCSTNPDTLRTCFLPSILSSQIVSKVDATPAQILIALLPACRCSARIFLLSIITGGMVLLRKGKLPS